MGNIDLTRWEKLTLLTYKIIMNFNYLNFFENVKTNLYNHIFAEILINRRIVVHHSIHFNVFSRKIAVRLQYIFQHGETSFYAGTCCLSRLKDVVFLWRNIISGHLDYSCCITFFQALKYILFYTTWVVTKIERI